jgi:hypothetical protein
MTAPLLTSTDFKAIHLTSEKENVLDVLMTSALKKCKLFDSFCVPSAFKFSNFYHVLREMHKQNKLYQDPLLAINNGLKLDTDCEFKNNFIELINFILISTYENNLNKLIVYAVKLQCKNLLEILNEIYHSNLSIDDIMKELPS